MTPRAGLRLNHTTTRSSVVHPKVLVIDDDCELVDLLVYSLERAGMYVSGVFDAPSAIRQFDTWQPDLVLLEIMLGGGATGPKLLSNMRRRSEVPIIIVTALSSEDDTVRALDLGADDYVTKPFSHSELIARIRSQLAMAGREFPVPGRLPEYLQVGPLTLDTTERMLVKGARSVALTGMEFRLLSYLMTHADSIVPTDVILDGLWPQRAGSKTAALHVLVHRMRRKLEDDPTRPTLLCTVPNVGFRLACDGGVESEHEHQSAAWHPAKRSLLA